MAGNCATTAGVTEAPNGDAENGARAHPDLTHPLQPRARQSSDQACRHGSEEKWQRQPR